jgi:hypothetical protein
VVPLMPATPAVAPLTGEQWSQLLYGGPGSAGLRDFGAALYSTPTLLKHLPIKSTPLSVRGAKSCSSLLARDVWGDIKNLCLKE